MARTQDDSYTKAAVKAPRKVSVSTGGQASNVKAGSKTSKSSGQSYCLRPKPSDDEVFPKPDEPFEIKDPKKKPAETAVASDEIVECSCSVDEVDSENAGPSKSADEVDSENAGPSKSADEVDSENAGPSKNAEEVDSEKAGPSREYDEMDYEELRSVKVVCKGEIINANPLRGEDYILIDDDTFVVIDDADDTFVVIDE